MNWRRSLRVARGRPGATGSDPFSPSGEWRPLTDLERDLLEALTSQDFLGARELHLQIPHTRARQGCGCGCGTVVLTVDEGKVGASPVTRSPVPGEATVLDSVGTPVGGLILFVRLGYLTSLEIYNWGEPLPLPAVNQIRPYVAR